MYCAKLLGMKAYSQDLRERIVAARLKGQSITEVAGLFDVSDSTVEKYWRLHRRGASLAVGRSPGKPPRLAPQQEAALVALVQENTNWTLEQLSQEWQARTGVFLPRSTMHDHLRRLGVSYKKRVTSQKNAAK